MDYKIMSPSPWGGDGVEKYWWPRVGKEIPFYETIWANIIILLTNRPHKLSLREDLSDTWGKFAECHYSIYLHLVVTLERSDYCNKTLLAYEDVYAHLATIFDIFDAFLTIIHEITTGEKPQIPTVIIDKEAFISHMENWFKGNRGERYRDKIQRISRTFAFNPFEESCKDLFLKIIKDENLWSKFANLKRIIGSRRNLLVHEAARAKLVCSDGRIFVHRDDEAFRKYPTWIEVQKIKDRPQEIDQYFIDIVELSKGDIFKMLELSNMLLKKIWENYGNTLIERIPKKRPKEKRSARLYMIYDSFMPEVSGMTVTAGSPFSLSAHVKKSLIEEF